jgi:hypothetical protein
MGFTKDFSFVTEVECSFTELVLFSHRLQKGRQVCGAVQAFG